MARLIKIHSSITQQAREFLKLNKLGTPGKSMVYTQLRTMDKLDHIKHPRLMQLSKNDNILATCCLCQREVREGNSYYVRYFSFHPKFRSATLSRPSKNSQVKKEILQILDGDGLDAGTFYAYVDLKNVRSARLCQEFGFKEIGNFQTLTFSKLFPSKIPGIEKLKSQDHENVRQKLEAFYTDYQFYSEENLFFDNSYFVIKDSKGEILAGVQAVEEKWQIESLSGKRGKFMLNVISRTPLLNKLMSHNFEFISIDYIYCPSGNEVALEKLLTSVLAEKQKNVALIAVDIKSSIHSSILKMKTGPLSKFQNPVTASIISRSTKAFSYKNQELMNKPCFISTLDMM